MPLLIIEDYKMSPFYMTVSEAAEYLSISVPTLNRYRCQGVGPKYAKLGSSIRYTNVDLDEWVRANTIAPRRSAQRLGSML